MSTRRLLVSSSQMKLHNIAIVGVGGVGGYFGGKLCRLRQADPPANVSLVARGEHLEAIKSSGLMLSTESDGELVCEPDLVTDDFSQLPDLDLCLVCVKQFDLTAALSKVNFAIGDATVILPLLNGVDISVRVRGVIDRGIVLPACVYVGTHIERPGRVVQRGGACRILMGPDPRRPDFAPHQLLELFHSVGIKSDWTLNIESEIWSKYIFICAFGLVSAASGKTLGEICEAEALQRDVATIIHEAVELAVAAGMSLPPGTAERSLAKASGFPYGAKTSFQRDFERNDRCDERDLFVGTMVRLADEFGVSIPRTREVAEVLEHKKPLPPTLRS